MKILSNIAVFVLSIVALINLAIGCVLGWILKEHYDNLEDKKKKEEDDDEEHEKILKAIDDEYLSKMDDDDDEEDYDFLT